VPDTLCRAGYAVAVKGGPGPSDYSAYVEVPYIADAVRRLGIRKSRRARASGPVRASC